MRRVLIVPEWYPWPETPGLGVWVREQARALAGEGEVVVLASAASAAAAPPGIADAVEDGLRVVRVRFRGGRPSQLAFLRRLAGLLAGLRGLARSGFHPDLVHAHVFSAGLPALALAARARCPVVVSEHYSGFPLGLLSRWDRLIARFVFTRADLVCPASASLAATLAEIAPRARLRPMPNPVDTSIFFPPESPPAGEPVAVCVGALKERKGHPELLEALKLARADRPDLRLELVGDGPDRKALERRAGELGIEGAVRFRGRLDKGSVAEAMRRASFLVLPSLWENQPLAVIEALASGLPVIATRVGGVAEIVDRDAGVLVPPGNVSALGAALVEMCARAGDYDRQALARRAERRFGYEAVARAWREAYAEASAHREARIGGSWLRRRTLPARAR